MRWVLTALVALGSAYAAAYIPALRWTEGPDGDALLAYVSEPVGVWESVTPDGRPICVGPPLTAANFTIAPERLTQHERAQASPRWPGIAETTTADGHVVCVAPDDEVIGAARRFATRTAKLAPPPPPDIAAPARPYGLVAASAGAGPRAFIRADLRTEAP
jgi:hypothetical protein